jgi:hypothetical protein
LKKYKNKLVMDRENPNQLTEEYRSSEAILPEDEAIYFIYPAGLMPGFMISASTLRQTEEAEKKIRERKDKDKRPPKPPSRPNARVRVGGFALGHGF